MYLLPRTIFIPAYHVNPSNDHDACMNIFAEAGIYAFIDVATFNTQIDGKHPQWTTPQYESFINVIDEFQKYDNVAGFFITNEVQILHAVTDRRP